jgi:hypothetical protein
MTAFARQRTGRRSILVVGPMRVLIVLGNFHSPSPSLFTQKSMIGIMLMKQPFFMGGIDDVEVAKGSAFGAAGTFFFTFIVSIVYMIHDAQRLAEDRNIDNGVGDRSGGRQGNYGQVPMQATIFRDFDDPVNTDVPETFENAFFD